MRVAKRASSSHGVNFSPQALNPNAVPASEPFSRRTKMGPESRAHASSIGTGTTSTPVPHAARASACWEGWAAISTGSKAATAFAVAA